MTTPDLLAQVRADLAAEIQPCNGCFGVGPAAELAACPRHGARERRRAWLAELADRLEESEEGRAVAHRDREQAAGAWREALGELAGAAGLDPSARFDDVRAQVAHVRQRAGAAEAEVARLNLPENRGIGDGDIVAALQERDRLKAEVRALHLAAGRFKRDLTKGDAEMAEASAEVARLKREHNHAVLELDMARRDRDHAEAKLAALERYAAGRDGQGAS